MVFIPCKSVYCTLLSYQYQVHFSCMQSECRLSAVSNFWMCPVDIITIFNSLAFPLISTHSTVYQAALHFHHAISMADFMKQINVLFSVTFLLSTSLSHTCKLRHL